MTKELYFNYIFSSLLDIKLSFRYSSSAFGVSFMQSSCPVTALRKLRLSHQGSRHRRSLPAKSLIAYGILVTLLRFQTLRVVRGSLHITLAQPGRRRLPLSKSTSIESRKAEQTEASGLLRWRRNRLRLGLASRIARKSECTWSSRRMGQLH